MKTVYKYPLDIAATQQIKLPLGAKVIHVGLDPQQCPCIWAEVDNETAQLDYTFHVCGTGHEVPDNVKHVGSFQQGPFMWHVYMNERG